MKKIILLLMSLVLCDMAQAQTWYSAAVENCIYGQGWTTENARRFQRLPTSVGVKVTSDIWNVARNGAGLYVRFKTNSTTITVKYKMRNAAVRYPQLSTLGQSGVDLYARSADGKTFHWIGNRLSFSFAAAGSESTLTFSGIDPTKMEGQSVCEYQLYLPTFNSVATLRIGVNEGSSFEFVPVSGTDKPIVVYGSAAVEGGSVTHAGNIWPSRVGRELDANVINLGLFDRAKLQDSVMSVVSELDAEMFIIDAIPDLTDEVSAIQEKVEKAVRTLRAKSQAPILLTEGPGCPDSMAVTYYDSIQTEANAQLKAAYLSLQKAGVKNLFYMTRAELALTEDAMSDGVNPNDIGMKEYADAYVRKIKYIREHKEVIPDGIAGVKRENAQGAVYDLEGRYCGTDMSKLPKGIYVVNGRKVRKD
jgi:hypothetical protein